MLRTALPLALCLGLAAVPGQTAEAFRGSIGPIPDDVAALMRQYTWHAGCPVTLDQLAYLRLAYWGFDGAVHDGEMVVYAPLADEVMEIFRTLFDNKFPMAKMQVTARYGDRNISHDDDDTEAFDCRPDFESPGKFSKHAYGIAIDINPVENPLVAKSGVSPADGAANADRSVRHPGGIYRGDPIVGLFADHGWAWGGFWDEPDIMHFQKLMNGNYEATRLRLVPEGEALKGLGD